MFKYWWLWFGFVGLGLDVLDVRVLGVDGDLAMGGK